MGIESALFSRTQLLTGEEDFHKIEDARVIIFGVGGVGSWCAEALIRTGVKNLTIVDSDRVCITNVNRQIMADTTTIGEVKVEALKERLLKINPQSNIKAIREIFSAETSKSFDLDSYDFVIDAIDSLKDKVALILMATKSKAKFYSSMGAALKLDPTKIRVDEFWNVKGCPLARSLRQKFKKNHLFPSKKFKCVYSEELLENKGNPKGCGTTDCVCPKIRETSESKHLENHEWCSKKARINGSLVHITAIFGMTISGLVISDIIKN